MAYSRWGNHREVVTKCQVENDGLKKRLSKYALFIFICMSRLAPSTGFALDSADVLPSGINSPAFRVGVVSGIGQKYDSAGRLVSLNDVHSIEFDSKELARFEPRVQELVDALNQFGRQGLGDALTLGSLRIETSPDVRYVAPVHAYGVTPRWTVAVGVPVVTYNNKISMRQTGSNLNAIRSQVGNISSDLNAAFEELNVSLVSTAQKELSSKGYKPLADRSETFIGDVQLASLYQFHHSPAWTGLLKTFVTLPTGPGDDPDDLADLGIFGQSAIEQTALITVRPFRRLSIAAKGAYRYVIPDEVVKRVPTSEDDTLPGIESKRSVKRQTGGTVSAGVSGSLELLSRLSAGVGYEISRKASDQYSGAGPGDVSVLSKDTDSIAQRVRAGISYSSTEAYMRKEAMLPAIVSYEISDTIRGVNVERQTIHELWVTLFF